MLKVFSKRGESFDLYSGLKIGHIHPHGTLSIKKVYTIFFINYTKKYLGLGADIFCNANGGAFPKTIFYRIFVEISLSLS